MTTTDSPSEGYDPLTEFGITSHLTRRERAALWLARPVTFSGAITAAVLAFAATNLGEALYARWTYDPPAPITVCHVGPIVTVPSYVISADVERLRETLAEGPWCADTPPQVITVGGDEPS